MIYEIIVDISNSEIDKVYDYSSKFYVEIGSRVQVPFGSRKIEGYVINQKSDSKCKNLKEKIKLLDKKINNQEMLYLVSYLNKKKNLRYIDTLRLCLPAQLRGSKIKELKKSFVTLLTNMEEAIKEIPKNAKNQYAIVESLQNEGEYESVLNSRFSSSSVKALIDKKIIKREYIVENRIPYKNIISEKKEIFFTKEQNEAIKKISSSNDIFLIHGVTGSGKTEIYMKIIEEEIKKGKSAIMLVPEISLTPQMLGIFRSRFGYSVSLLHSGLSGGERYDEWRRLSKGQAKVALGARSAIFAPLQNIGVIIIDEEHDTSYISESNPRYFTHEIAKFRRKYNDAKLIFGSATPSLDTYKRAKENEYKLITLRNRVNEREMPDMEIVDMRNEIRKGNNSIFSEILLTQLEKTIRANNQAMFFINRRGYSSFVRCKVCGYIPKCTDCEVSLTLHKDDNRLKCHYCGKQFYNITECPICGNKNISQGRIGTEKVVEELKKLYPKVKTLRMDVDTTKTKNSYIEILSAFAKGEAQILVGTQMIAKGHDFKNVTLVGILDADLSLYFSDYRSNETTFQLITQVAGRAGREQKQGKVVMQTFNPNHYVFRYAKNYDYVGFFEKESNIREATHFPPYSIIVRILIFSENEEKAMTSAREGYNLFRELKKNTKDGIFRVQAMRAPMKRLMNKYRFQIVLWLKNEYEKDILPKIYCEAKKINKKGITSFVEINPTQMI